MHPERRALGVGWVALLAVVLVLAYATSRDAVPLSSWQYAFYGFLALVIATPIVTEIQMRRDVARRMKAVAADLQARVRHRFVAIRMTKPLGRRPKIEARYAGGAFETLTIAPRYATRLSSGIPTDVISMFVQALEILATAASGRVLFVASATLTRPIPDFSISIRPRKAGKESRHGSLPPWIAPRSGSDPSTVSRVTSQYGLAGLGPNSGIRSISVRAERLAVVTSDVSERAMESALAATDILHSLSIEPMNGTARDRRRGKAPV